MKNIITHMTRNDLKMIVQKNPGQLVIMFTASWCGPCAAIKHTVLQWMNTLPSSVICAVLDVDQNTDITSFQKSMKQMKGVPTLHCFTKNVVSDFGVSGGDVRTVNAFFDEVEGRC